MKVDKVVSLLGFVTLALIRAAHAVAGAQSTDRTRYIITHLKSHTLELPDDTAIVKQLDLNSTHQFTFADLTVQQAHDIESQVQANYGAIQPDGVSQLDFEFDADNYQAWEQTSNTTLDEISSAAKQTYLKTPKTCSNCVPNDNTVLIWPDTLINYKLSVFNDIDFSYGPNYVEPTPCNPHGAYTLAEAVGRNGYGTVTKGKPKVINIGIFDCGGKQNDTNGIEAFLWIAQTTRELRAQGKNVIVSYSVSGGAADPAFRAAVQVARDAGALLAFSAGNDGTENYCRIQLRNVPGVLQIGATKPDGYTLEYYTNFGSCVAGYLNGDITTFNGQTDTGTSFAIPAMTGRAYCIWTQNPAATAAQIYNASLEGMYGYYPTNYWNFNRLTLVMPTDNYCKFPVVQPLVIPSILFTNVNTNANKVVRYYATNQNNFCVTYAISTRSGASNVNITNFYADEYVLLTVGISYKKSWRHTLTANGMQLAQKVTANRIIGAKPVTFRWQQAQQSLAIDYQAPGAAWQNLFTVDMSIPLNSVGVSGLKCSYQNAITCTV